MRKLEYSEPFGVQLSYAEDGDIQIKDGNVIWTFLCESHNQMIAVDRVIMPLCRYLRMREKARIMLPLNEPAHIMDMIQAPPGKPLS